MTSPAARPGEPRNEEEEGEWIVTLTAIERGDAAGQMFAATAGTVEQIRALLGEQLQDFILPHSESSAILDAASAEGFVLLGEPTEEP